MGIQPEVESKSEGGGVRGFVIEMIPTGRGSSYVKLNQPHG